MAAILSRPQCVKTPGRPGHQPSHHWLAQSMPMYVIPEQFHLIWIHLDQRQIYKEYYPVVSGVPVHIFFICDLGVIELTPKLLMLTYI